jgi:hypothetical protein
LAENQSEQEGQNKKRHRNVTSKPENLSGKKRRKVEIPETVVIEDEDEEVNPIPRTSATRTVLNTNKTPDVILLVSDDEEGLSHYFFCS